MDRCKRQMMRSVKGLFLSLICLIVSVSAPPKQVKANEKKAKRSQSEDRTETERNQRQRRWGTHQWAPEDAERQMRKRQEVKRNRQKTRVEIAKIRQSRVLSEGQRKRLIQLRIKNLELPTASGIQASIGYETVRPSIIIFERINKNQLQDAVSLLDQYFSEINKLRQLKTDEGNQKAVQMEMEMVKRLVVYHIEDIRQIQQKSGYKLQSLYYSFRDHPSSLSETDYRRVVNSYRSAMESIQTLQRQQATATSQLLKKIKAIAAEKYMDLKEQLEFLNNQAKEYLQQRANIDVDQTLATIDQSLLTIGQGDRPQRAKHYELRAPVYPLDPKGIDPKIRPPPKIVSFQQFKGDTDKKYYFTSKSPPIIILTADQTEKTLQMIVQGSEMSKTLERYVSQGLWKKVRQSRFDQYLFPTSQASQVFDDMFMTSLDEINILRNSNQFLMNTAQAVVAVCQSWGYNVYKQSFESVVEEGQGLQTDFDARLTRMTESCRLLGLYDLHLSLLRLGKCLALQGYFGTSEAGNIRRQYFLSSRIEPAQGSKSICMFNQKAHIVSEAMKQYEKKYRETRQREPGPLPSQGVPDRGQPIIPRPSQQQDPSRRPSTAPVPPRPPAGRTGRGDKRPSLKVFTFVDPEGNTHTEYYEEMEEEQEDQPPGGAASRPSQSTRQVDFLPPLPPPRPHDQRPRHPPAPSTKPQYEVLDDQQVNKRASQRRREQRGDERHGRLKNRLEKGFRRLFSGDKTQGQKPQLRRPRTPPPPHTPLPQTPKKVPLETPLTPSRQDVRPKQKTIKRSVNNIEYKVETRPDSSTYLSLTKQIAHIQPRKVQFNPVSFNIFRDAMSTGKQMRVWAANKDWSTFKFKHYDWWVFPINENSRGKGNRYTMNQLEAQKLLATQSFVENIKFCANAVCRSFGYDMQKQQMIKKRDPGQGLEGGFQDRLYKVARSLELLGLHSQFLSVARLLQLYRDKGYVYFGPYQGVQSRQSYFDNLDLPPLQE